MLPSSWPHRIPGILGHTTGNLETPMYRRLLTVEHLTDDLIDHLVKRIISEVPGINRVLFDYTPKPPATVEYE